MTTTTGRTTTSLDDVEQTRARIGLLVLLAGTALNMWRMAPIFLSDGFTFEQLPPGNPDDLASVATLSGWYLSHVMAIVSVPLLVYGFVTVHQLVTRNSTNAVAERITLASVFGMATGAILYLIAAIIDGVAVPRAVNHFLDSTGAERDTASTVMMALHHTAASFGGHFMATALLSTGLLALGLYKLDRRGAHSIIGITLGVVALLGVTTGILDVSFQERFPLLGGIVGLMMLWWIALVVVLRREVKTA